MLQASIQLSLPCLSMCCIACKWVTGPEEYISLNYDQGSGHFPPDKSWHASLNFNQ